MLLIIHLRKAHVLCFIAILLISFMPLSSSAQSSHKAEWLACESDDQCVVVGDGCGDVAVNRKYSNQVVPRPPSACEQLSPANPYFVAKCFHKECIVRFP